MPIETKEWSDVCLKNVVIYLSACIGMDIDPEVVLNALPENLADIRARFAERWNVVNAKHKSREKRRWDLCGLAEDLLSGKWVTLAEYQRIEDAFVEATGHATHLVEEGRYAGPGAFGSKRILGTLLRAPILRYFTTPAVGVRLVPSESSSFVRNKRFEAVTQGSGWAVYAIRYVLDKRTGILRTAEEDQRSLLQHIRGVLESIAPIWRFQRRPGNVRYLTVDIRPQAVLAKEWPSARMELTLEGNLLINGEMYGRVVHLKRDRATGLFLGDYQGDSGSGTIPAILITRDVRTPCAKTGEQMPIMRQGEIYRHEVPLENLVELRWRTNPLMRLFERTQLPAQLESGVADDRDRADTTHELVGAQAELRDMKQAVERSYPTPAIADAVTSGKWRPVTLPTVSMELDLVGFERRTRGWPPEMARGILEPMMSAFKEAARRHGLHPYKQMGDGLIIVAAMWPSREPLAYADLREAARAMEELGDELHKIAQASPVLFYMRVGTGYDEVAWSAPEPGREWEGSGQGLVDSSRQQQFAAKAGTTACSTGFMNLLHGGDVRPALPQATAGGYMWVPNIPTKDGGEISSWRKRVLEVPEGDPALVASQASLPAVPAVRGPDDKGAK